MCARGEEFNFSYQNEKYWISQNLEDFYKTKVNGSITQEFNTSEQFFMNGTIEGILLSEIYMGIEW